jgi:hypothetical protein
MTVTRKHVRLGVVIAVAAAVGVVAWLLLRDGDDSGESADVTGPVEVSVAQLRDAARSSDTPVYWAGEIAGRKMEFRKTGSGRTFLRYLPEDEEIGGTRATFLTVGTYPVGRAYQALRASARRRNTSSTRIEGGGLLVGRDGGSRSVHFAFPRSGYQVEVFDPVDGEARKLVLDGRVRQVR